MLCNKRRQHLEVIDFRGQWFDSNRNASRFIYQAFPSLIKAKVTKVDCLAVNKPYLAAYTDVVTKDYADPANKVFKKTQGFFIKYIIKIPPATHGPLTFKVSENDLGQRFYYEVVRLKILSIGDNLPCLDDIPTTIPDEYFTTKVDQIPYSAQELKFVVRTHEQY